MKKTFALLLALLMVFSLLPMTAFADDAQQQTTDTSVDDVIADVTAAYDTSATPATGSVADAAAAVETAINDTSTTPATGVQAAETAVAAVNDSSANPATGAIPDAQSAITTVNGNNGAVSQAITAANTAKETGTNSVYSDLTDASGKTGVKEQLAEANTQLGNAASKTGDNNDVKDAANALAAAEAALSNDTQGSEGAKQQLAAAEAALGEAKSMLDTAKLVQDEYTKDAGNVTADAATADTQAAEAATQAATAADAAVKASDAADQAEAAGDQATAEAAAAVAADALTAAETAQAAAAAAVTEATAKADAAAAAYDEALADLENLKAALGVQGDITEENLKNSPIYEKLLAAENAAKAAETQAQEANTQATNAKTALAAAEAALQAAQTAAANAAAKAESAAGKAAAVLTDRTTLVKNSLPSNVSVRNLDLSDADVIAFATSSNTPSYYAVAAAADGKNYTITLTGTKNTQITHAGSGNGQSYFSTNSSSSRNPSKMSLLQQDMKAAPLALEFGTGQNSSSVYVQGHKNEAAYKLSVSNGTWKVGNGNTAYYLVTNASSATTYTTNTYYGQAETAKTKVDAVVDAVGTAAQDEKPATGVVLKVEEAYAAYTAAVTAANAAQEKAAAASQAATTAKEAAVKAEEDFLKLKVQGATVAELEQAKADADAAKATAAQAQTDADAALKEAKDAKARADAAVAKFKNAVEEAAAAGGTFEAPEVLAEALEGEAYAAAVKNNPEKLTAKAFVKYVFQKAGRPLHLGSDDVEVLIRGNGVKLDAPVKGALIILLGADGKPIGFGVADSADEYIFFNEATGKVETASMAGKNLVAVKVGL